MERVDLARPAFSLGRIVATPGALDCLSLHGTDPMALISRHRAGDWGELTSDDRAMNDCAVNSGERILSSYPVGLGERVWVITEADRSVTTLLLPSEY